MSRKVRLPALLLAVGVTALVASGQSGTQRRGMSEEEVLTRHTGVAGKQHGGVVDALVLGLTIAQVPGGVVAVDNCGGYNPTVKVPPNSSVKDLLDQIVLASPQYRWHVDDGVINVIPDTNLTAPLDIKISKFKVESVSASDALNQLLEEPEVRQGIEGLNFHQGARAFGGGFPISKARISLDLKNVTLQEALNSIVRADGRALWALLLRPCNGRNEYDISLLIN